MQLINVLADQTIGKGEIFILEVIILKRMHMSISMWYRMLVLHG